jgi:hypothetical protein
MKNGRCRAGRNLVRPSARDLPAPTPNATASAEIVNDAIANPRFGRTATGGREPLYCARVHVTVGSGVGIVPTNDRQDSGSLYDPDLRPRTDEKHRNEEISPNRAMSAPHGHDRIFSAVRSRPRSRPARTRRRFAVLGHLKISESRHSPMHSPKRNGNGKISRREKRREDGSSEIRGADPRRIRARGDRRRRDRELSVPPRGKAS